MTIALRRELSPRDNLARLFRRARGLERHRSAIEARLAEAEARSAALAELRAAIAADVAGDQAPELEARAAALAVRGAAPQAQRSRKQQTRSLPAGVQRWTSPAGAEVLVGRSAAANDTLVTRLARGRDIWMHVRDRRGAHLLLRSGKDAQPALAELQACAALCAWASGVRRGDRVDVTWTWARHVRKAKGSAPGLVYIAKEHTLRVDVHDAVIAAFKERRSAEAKGAKGS